MNWKNILKAYGDKHKDKDGDTHIEGYGFIPKPYTKDRHPKMRDEEGKPLEGEERDKRMDEYRKDRNNPNTDLVNWFKSIEQTFDSMLNSIDISVVSGSDKKGFRALRRDGTHAGKMISKYGNEITKGIIDEMLSGYLQGISPTPSQYNTAKFKDDDTTNIASILSSTGYIRTSEAGLKVSEEMLTDFFDTAYRSIKQLHDASDDDEDLEAVEMKIRDPVDPKIINEVWEVLGGDVEEDIDNMITQIDEKLDDIIVESVNLDIDGDGKPDVSKEDIVKSIKLELKKHVATPEFTNDIKQFIGNVHFLFNLKYRQSQRDMESNEEVADQVTEEDADEYRKRPEIEFGDEEFDKETRRRMEEDDDKKKSFGQRTDKLDWKSILKNEVGLTTNADFSPAIHNLSYGKKPCKSCKNKKTSCGCE